MIYFYFFPFDRTILLIIGWLVFFFLAYKTSQIEQDFTEYDPYVILQLGRVSI